MTKNDKPRSFKKRYNAATGDVLPLHGPKTKSVLNFKIWMTVLCCMAGITLVSVILWIFFYENPPKTSTSRSFRLKGLGSIIAAVPGAFGGGGGHTLADQSVRVHMDMVMESGLSESESFLKNRYWILRHGKSIPNERGLIVSSLENGTLEEYHLASDGVHQARSAGESFLKELKENKIELENVRICYSPFSRTRHTAEVVASVLNIPFQGPQCKAVGDIRERFFGPSFELKSHDKYPEIWALDEKDPFLRPEGGESVADVVARLTTALTMMETEFEKCTVLVVSHGDPLQILQTIIKAAKQNGKAAGNDLASRIEAIKVHSVLSQHRKSALDTGELRQLA